jgi:hypothetical protein
VVEQGYVPCMEEPPGVSGRQSELRETVKELSLVDGFVAYVLFDHILAVAQTISRVFS